MATELGLSDRYDVGSIVWAKVQGYPWWPAMVDHDPDVMDYMWTKEGTEIPTHYHVVFLGDEVSRSWIEPNKMKSFIESRTLREMGPFVTKGKDFRKKVKVSILAAMSALQMSIEDRLQKYSFMNRYKGNKKRHNEDKIGKENKAKQRKVDSKDVPRVRGLGCSADAKRNEENGRLYASIKGILDDTEKMLDSMDDLDSIYSDPDFTIESQKSDEEEEEFEVKSKREKKNKKKSGSKKEQRKVVAKEKENGEKAKRGRPRKNETNQGKEPKEKKGKKMKPIFGIINNNKKGDVNEGDLVKPEGREE